MNDSNAVVLASLPWRAGGLGDLVVLAEADGEPWRDLLVGIMASAEVAAAVVAAHNAGLVMHPGTADVNRVIRERLLAARTLRHVGESA